MMNSFLDVSPDPKFPSTPSTPRISTIEILCQPEPVVPKKPQKRVSFNLDANTYDFDDIEDPNGIRISAARRAYYEGIEEELRLNPGPPPPPLPFGWREVVTPEGDTYYAHAFGLKSQCERPETPDGGKLISADEAEYLNEIRNYEGTRINSAASATGPLLPRITGHGSPHGSPLHTVREDSVESDDGGDFGNIMDSVMTSLTSQSRMRPPWPDQDLVNMAAAPDSSPFQATLRDHPRPGTPSHCHQS